MNAKTETKLELSGLHHVTAITDRAADNVAFYTQVLGLRLVKKTVNQDDVSAYHLFYGDELGRPGTEMTFFDWPHAGPTRAGAGTVSEVALRVPQGALEGWAARLHTFGVAHQPIERRATQMDLALIDPEGQRLRLVEGGEAAASVWRQSTVAPEMQIGGLGGVTLSVQRLEPTARVLTDVLGFRLTREFEAEDESGAQANEAKPHRVSVFETGAGGLGAQVRVAIRPNLTRGRAGLGGVHHVAFRVPDAQAQQQWHERLLKAGLNASPVIDRFYFQSVYFLEPGGVLFEIATDGPGFATDEDASHLGEQLALPPFLEPHRARIEAGLQPLGTVDFSSAASSH